MGKKKLQRFAENKTFSHLLEPMLSYPPSDHELKGKWNSLFFEKPRPIVLELGCGRGEYTVNLALHYPENNYVGVDIKGARIWSGARIVHEKKMKNVGFLRIQIEHLENFFSSGEVSEIWLTFPDPQPQRSREKKRLTSPRFLSMYKSLLQPGGLVHLKTDNRDLYEYSMDSANRSGFTVECNTNNLYESTSVDEVLSIKTTYEKAFLNQGMQICYLKLLV